MANTKSQRERERRAQRDQAARRAAEKADRRRRTIAIAACGVVLLAVGATFEQRRRDLVDLKGRFESLR